MDIHLTNEPALQFVLALEPKFRHPLLGARTLTPLNFRCFVPAHMNEPSRKEIHHL